MIANKLCYLQIYYHLFLSNTPGVLTENPKIIYIKGVGMKWCFPV